MIQLAPIEFTFGRYGLGYIPWEVLKSDNGFIRWLLVQNIIGYCNSMECEIRPKVDEMAVMFEDETGWQSWFHIPIDVWIRYLEQLKIRG